MNNYLPIDDRANTTFNLLLEPFMNSLSAAQNVKDIVETLTTYLPSGMAHGAELRMRMNRTIKEIMARKQLVDEIE